MFPSAYVPQTCSPVPMFPSPSVPPSNSPVPMFPSPCLLRCNDHYSFRSYMNNSLEMGTAPIKKNSKLVVAGTYVLVNIGPGKIRADPFGVLKASPMVADIYLGQYVGPLVPFEAPAALGCKWTSQCISRVQGILYGLRIMKISPIVSRKNLLHWGLLSVGPRGSGDHIVKKK